MFWTAVNGLRSPENAGMIVRSHVAFGGEDIVVIGQEPWRFKKRAEGFSRRCQGIVTISQFGPVGSLNATVSVSIAMYEFTRKQSPGRAIVDGKYWVAEDERPDNRTV